MVILEGILDHEEREDKQQFQYLKTTQLAIMTFFDTDAGRTQMEMTDCSHNAIYRQGPLAGIEPAVPENAGHGRVNSKSPPENRGRYLSKE